MRWARRTWRVVAPALLALVGVVAAGALGSGRWDPGWLRVAPWPVADVGSSSLLRVPGIEGAFSAEQQGPDGRLLWRLTGAGLRSRSLREHDLSAPRLWVWPDTGPPLSLTARAATIELFDPEDLEGNPERTRAVVDLVGEVAAQGSGWSLASEAARVELAEPAGRDGPRRIRLSTPGAATIRSQQAGWELELVAAGLLVTSDPGLLRLVGPVQVNAARPPQQARPRGQRLSGRIGGLTLRALPASGAAAASAAAAGARTAGAGAPAADAQRAQLELEEVSLRGTGEEQQALAAARFEARLLRDPAAARASLGGLAGACAGPRMTVGASSWRVEEVEARAPAADLARVGSDGAPLRRDRWGLAGARLHARAAPDGQGGTVDVVGEAQVRVGEDLLAGPALRLTWSGPAALVEGQGGLSWERRTRGRDGAEELHRVEAARARARLASARPAWEAERARRRALRREGLRLFAPSTVEWLEASGDVRLSGPRGLSGGGHTLGWDGRAQLLRLEAGPGIQGGASGPGIQGGASGPDIQGGASGPGIQGVSGGPPARLASEGLVLTARAIAAWQLAEPGAPPTWLVAAAGQVEAHLSPAAPRRAPGPARPGQPAAERRLPPLRLGAGHVLALVREVPHTATPGARRDRTPLLVGLSAGGPSGGGTGGVSLHEQGGPLAARAASLRTRTGPRGPVLELGGRPGSPVRLEQAGTSVLAPAAEVHLLEGGRSVGLAAERGWQASFLLGPSTAPRPATAQGERLYVELVRDGLTGPAGPAGPAGPEQAARLLRALTATGGLRLDAARLSASAERAELLPGTRTLRLSGAPAALTREGNRHEARELLLHLQD